MAIGDDKPSASRSDAETADSKSVLQSLLSRGSLGSKDAKDLEVALKDKKVHAERAAEALAAAWSTLPKELQMIPIRWKWQERRPESRAKACMTLGAAVAASDPVSASSLLSEAMKVMAAKAGMNTRTATGSSGGSATPDLRAVMRTSLIERWLRPIDSAALFRIRYTHLARESRPSFDSLIVEALGSLPGEFRTAVVKWIERQSSEEPTQENRHALATLLGRLSPVKAEPAAPPPGPIVGGMTDLTNRKSELPAAISAVATTSGDLKAEAPQPQAASSVGQLPRAHPRTLIADAVRVIQSELKRWSTEESDELGKLRRRVTDSEESLKRRTNERDELASALSNARDRVEGAERGLAEAVEQRDRAIATGERLEREVHALNLRVADQERRCAESEASSSRLDQELKQAREDKRKDVEYTRESERAATAKQIEQAARVHLENMHELLAAAPSEKQRAALVACYEELFKVLAPPNGRSKG